MTKLAGTVRDLTDADVDRVFEINQANVPEVGSVDVDRLRFIIAESAIALVVEIPVVEIPVVEPPVVEIPVVELAVVELAVGARQEVAGFCLVLPQGSAYDSVNYRWFMDRYDDALYLDRVAFDASTQGKGLGSALYSEVGRRLDDLGAALTLEVNLDPPNEPSLAFHRKHGFVEVGRQMSKGIEVSLMHKPAR